MISCSTEPVAMHLKLCLKTFGGGNPKMNLICTSSPISYKISQRSYRPLLYICMSKPIVRSRCCLTSLRLFPRCSSNFQNMVCSGVFYDE